MNPIKECNKVMQAIYDLQKAMDEEEVNPIEGLPLGLFEFSTTLLPFVNVDLLILNHHKQILLSWRDDFHYGTGWQIPGGIIRMMEKIEDRIWKTAEREIGCRVEYDPEPIVVHENIITEERAKLRNQLERAHNIALLYKCYVPEEFVIDNQGREENDEGYLCWFDKFPENLLDCHKPLKNYEALREWF